MSKIFLAILAIVFLSAFSGSIADGIRNFRTDDLTQSSAVTTGVGVTTGNITLGSDLYQDNTSHISTITSNVTGETPVATGYTTASNILNVGSLQASTTRMLTVNYYAAIDDDYMNIIGPFMAFLIFGGILFAIVWGVWKQFKER